MKSLILPRVDDSKPRYLQIADAIRAAISRGQLKPGERVPSLRRLAADVGVNRHTVMNALHELVAQGWLVSSERSGYFVPESFPELSVQAPERSVGSRRSSLALRIVRDLPALPQDDSRRWRTSFASSSPDLRLFPFKEFRRHLTELDRSAMRPALDYGDPRGDPALIEVLEVYLRRFRGVTGRSIVVVNGAQEGLYLIAQCLLRRGDAVAVERLGYPQAWQVFRSAGADLVPLDIDEHGVIPESLQRVARRRKIRLLYLTPLHQFPTTVTLAPARRKRILEMARTYRIPILEDDYDHEFHYRRRPIAPLASDDASHCVVYLSTFSKVLFPSLRLGMVAASDELADAICRYRTIVNQRVGSLNQRALAHWMADGGFERHLRRVSTAYRLRRDAMVERLGTLSVDFRVPDGGMAVWVDTGRSAASIARKASSRGIYVPNESSFSLDATGTHLRLGFARLDEREIRAGVDALADVLRGRS